MLSFENEPWKYLKQRFGILKDEMSDYRIIQRSDDSWIVSRGTKDASLDLKLETSGIRLLRKTGRGLKPTTYGLQLMEDYIDKNTVKLERDELLKLLRREEMVPVDLEKEGYVALEFKGKIVGCGMYKEGVVSSRVPKGRGGELAEILDHD